MRVHTSLAALAVIVSSTAQAPPTQPVGNGLSGFWDALNNPALASLGQSLSAVSFAKLANNGPGEWTAALTMYQGSSVDLQIARWSPNRGGTATLTPTGEAANLNTPDDEFLLSIEPSQGLLAVFDRFSPVSGAHLGVFLASRSAPGTPFGPAVAIANVVGTQGWSDPALGYVGGQLMLFYGGLGSGAGGAQDAILMAPLDLTNPAAPTAGTPAIVAVSNLGFVPHSPTPVIGADGDVEGLWLGEVDFNSGDSDMFFADDLDPTTPHEIVFDNADWLNGGGVAGGYFAAADYTSFYVQLREGDAAWLVGDVEPMVAGGVQIDLTSGSPHAGGGVPNLTIFAAADALLAVPVPAPGAVLGAIGLTGTIDTLAFAVAPVAEDEITVWSTAVPFQAALAGLEVHVQALVLQPTTGLAMTTNTARVRL